MRIKLHSGARQDFDDAKRHYVSIRPDLAARFIDEVNAGFELIKQDPQRWRIVSGSIRRVLTKVFPFSILYIVEGEVVHVVAVAHSSRMPGYWAGRIENQ